MFYQLFPRMSMEENQQLASHAISADEQAVLIAGLTIYGIGGTSPSVAVAIETSDDGEIWANIGTIVSGTSIGLTFGNYVITANEWGRLVRARVSVSGVSAIAEFAVGLQTRISS